MMDMRILKCKRCRAEIHWATTKKGKFMPVDAKRVTAAKDGELLVDMNGNVFKALTGDIGYRSHFATCPAAAEFRKRSRKPIEPKEDRRYGD